MSNAEMNQVIAKRLGWTRYKIHHGDSYHWQWLKPGEKISDIYHAIPPFTSDLNLAMDAVREIVGEDFQRGFRFRFCLSDSLNPGKSNTLEFPELWWFFHLTAKAVSVALAAWIKEEKV